MIQLLSKDSRKIFSFFLIILLALSGSLRASTSFVIIIASYNNEKWCEWNLKSALDQKYDNFRIIYIDDKSKDRTGHLVRRLIKSHPQGSKVEYVRNKKRIGSALPNQYHAIHDKTEDFDVIVILDGDDALAHPNVLSHLDKEYRMKEKEVWLTYGQFWRIKRKHLGQCRRFHPKIVRENLFRNQPFIESHLRTFYSWLFKKIKKEDLCYEGDFIPVAGDVAMMRPMLEMAGSHIHYIPEVLYLYNDENPISDSVINIRMQSKMAMHVRKKHPYRPLKSAPKRV